MQKDKAYFYGMQKTLTINRESGVMSAQIVALAMLVLSIILAVFGVMYLAEGNISYGIMLMLAFAGLGLGAFYCAAFLIRVIVITPQNFMLKRPYARFWLKPMNTVQVSVPLNSIKEIRITKNRDSEGEEQLTWKITQHNGSNVSLKYQADPDDLQEAQKFFWQTGITFIR